MHRIDVYKNKKKVASQWYKTKEEATKAKKAIESTPERIWIIQPGENRPPKIIYMGGWTVSDIVIDNKYN